MPWEVFDSPVSSPIRNERVACATRLISPLVFVLVAVVVLQSNVRVTPWFPREISCAIGGISESRTVEIKE